MAAEPASVWVELIKIIPQLLWITVAFGAFLLLYRRLIDLVEGGGISNIQVWQLKIEFAQQQLSEIKHMAGAPKTPAEFQPFKDRIKRLRPKLTGATLLWVDDRHPFENTRERRALSALGITIDTVTNTEDAIKFLRNAAYDVVISDMNRPGQVDNGTFCGNSPDARGAGCGLLQAMHTLLGPEMPPTIIYATKLKPEWGTPAFASGITNRVDHLLNLILDALERRKPAI